ncbi:hypothetical protein HOD88_00630 [archaeon]|jgi:hypothetical protein|nr:hypothetical protein [archaeon]
MGGRVLRNSRHIRWNWEQSPDNEEMARYHFVIVDDKNRAQSLQVLISQLVRYNPGIEKIRESVEGKVFDSRLKYLFSSWDSVTIPEHLEIFRLGKPVKRDHDLVERVRGNIVDYVANTYERK